MAMVGTARVVRGAVALLVLGVAGAGDAQVPGTPADSGLMSFPNVSIIARSARGPDARAVAAAGAGLRAYLDPETGALTSDPTQAQIDSLQFIHPSLAAPQKSAPAKAHLVTTSRGARWAMLDRSRWSFAVARRGAEGADVDMACVDGDDQAGAFLATPVAASLVPARVQP